MVAVVNGIMEADQHEVFKRIPGHERQFAPRSEYLFKLLQPYLEEALFLGSTYEELFDRLEILLALTYVDLGRNLETDQVWGPAGRFGWKRHRMGGEDAYSRLVKEAEDAGEDWPLLQAGFFGRSYDRFTRVNEGFRGALDRLSWR